MTKLRPPVISIGSLIVDIEGSPNQREERREDWSNSRMRVHLFRQAMRCIRPKNQVD